ncbi:ice-binding family protein [Marinobacter sp. ATCH36]|uniref:ice-binding family protein n=1 Tax=Marinobacter sp. ATCH36 TaxID=2945106 RepID=UPI0020221E00|nr:ice-binding family protein [Marinobacter sp. ATCH36]MCL7943686.1 ice-binding family protein [Marinobacter sp. ATCH36]
MGIFNKYSRSIMTFSIALMSVSLVACNDSNNRSSTVEDETPVAIATLAVTSTGPADNATDVGTNTKVVAVFNKDMKRASLTGESFTLQGESGPAVSVDATYNAGTRTATLDPIDQGGLGANEVYTATVTTAAEDESGANLLEDFQWTFTTGTTTDAESPTVISSSPAIDAIDVLRNTTVKVTFSEAMDPNTLTADSFELSKNPDGPVVSGNLRYLNPTTVVLTPADDLEASTDYTLNLTTALADLAGNSLALVTIGFTTGTDTSAGPAAVDLGTAENYVILAETGISTTGTTSITGDIAVSPIDRTAITGFSETLSADETFATSPLVTGQIFAANMTSPTPANLTTAVSNMRTAYTDAETRVDPDFTELGAGEIGGLTLDPGLYKWGTGVLVTSDVTLNGSENDVWIFQIGQDLKLEDGKAIILTGGALPENVFWQVAGEVTLQAGTTFNGIILGKTGIVFKSGAVLNGRALAQTAVTLISNDVTRPAQ